jgi:hypothetical protein
VLGRWTLVYVALLSSVLHIAYLSIADLGFAFATALLFGFIVRRTQSIIGVALAHGFASIILFLGLPYLAQHSSPRILPLLIAMIVAVSIGGLGVSLLRWLQPPTPKPGVAPSPVTRLRVLRRLYGITYAELAISTGIPVRELAAIEHGLQAVAPERLPQLRQILGELPVIVPRSPDV